MSTAMRWLKQAGKQSGRIAALALVGGFLAATMVRMSPGFGTDEDDLALSLSAETHQALRARRLAESNVARFYLYYAAGVARGDFGFSRSLNRPVGELLRERLPETLRSVGWGAGGGFAAGLALALATVFWPTRAGDLAAGAGSALFLSTPAAVLALLLLWMGANARWAIAALVFAQVYRYARNLLAEMSAAPHVLAARARGISAGRILWAHVVAPCAPQLCAVAGVCATLAFGASIPVEAVCDVPGIGQLAWKAALGRDLPLLATITVLLAALTMTVNAAADLLIAALAHGGEAGAA